MEHCTVTGCHQTFSGPMTGDGHRVGTHTPDTRRCLTVDKMMAKGWRLVPCATGDMVWHGPAMSDELKAKRFGVKP